VFSRQYRDKLSGVFCAVFRIAEHSTVKKFKVCYKAPRVNAMYYDKIVAAMNPKYDSLFIEERQLNISQLDVFSRLMMDRIIFLGTGIDDKLQHCTSTIVILRKRRCF
jgi:hypothetical protein